MFRALVSFSGIISMFKDEVIEIKDKKIAKDLLDAGYITAVDKSQKNNKEVKTKAKLKK